MAFHLSKWYLDCVTDTGDAALLYWASLRWGLLRLSYGAALVLVDGVTEQRYTLSPQTTPEYRTDGSVRWQCNRLDVRARWTGGSSNIERTLLDDGRGYIRWDCLLPRSEASVLVGPHTLRGLGYVECLTLTVKPWRFPIDELRWGRFVSATNSLVWIRWHGPVPRTWVFANGVESADAVVGPLAVKLPDQELTIDEGQIIRWGRLSATALRSLGWAVSLVPRWRSAHETKWVAPAQLSNASGADSGWAVHEVVRWS